MTTLQTSTNSLRPASDGVAAAALTAGAGEDTAATAAATAVSAKPATIWQFSYMRVFACLFIVLLHLLFASDIYFASEMTKAQAAATCVVEHLLMWAVPCFLMVTGALLLNPAKQVGSKKLMKYLRRILLALIVFTLLFELIDVALGEQQASASAVLLGWLSDLVQGKSWAHMWYLYLMIGLYLLMPFYKVITAHCSDRLLLYLAGIYLVFVSVLPLTGLFGWDMGFYIPTTMVYPLYLFLGYLIHTKKLPADRSLGWILFVGFTAALVMLSVYRYQLAPYVLDEAVVSVIDSNLLGYSSLLVVGQAAGIFTIFDNLRIKEPQLERKGLRSVDACTFGIYLMHMVFIKVLVKHVGIDPFAFHPAVSFIALSILFFFFSYVIVWVIRKVSPVNVL